MRNIKRILIVMLVMCLAMTFAGCHKKNEIAVKIGDVKFTSAYYMCSLVTADMQAKSRVAEELSEEEQNSEQSIDYYSKKIDDKKYVDWVEDTAMDTLKEIAAYKILCKENKLEIEDEIASNAESYASYYWSNNGYSYYFEPNGVSLETYTQYITDSYYSELYFDFLYGEDGEKAIAAEDVKTKIHENFIIANVLQGSFTSEMDDTAKAELKTKLDGYVTDLQKGKKTFKEVYNDYNAVTEEEEAETEATDEPQPKDKYASILGDEGTGYEFEQYETVKAMATGEVKLIELEDEAGYLLVVKQDISADDYYLDTLDSTARHLIADEEFEKSIEDYQKELDVDENKYATGQFKVKKIKEPDYQ